MPALPAWLRTRATLFGLGLAGLAAFGAVAFYLSQATTLTIAVAPRDGTEPELIRAYAEALEAADVGIRLKILSFDDVRESAAALQDGRADLAVVRPDVALPTNALTLAILRDQAMIVAAPESAGISGFPKLAGRHLGIAAHKEADLSLLETLLGYYGLGLQRVTAPGARLPAQTVGLVPVAEGDAAQAIRDRRIDAFVSIIAPSAPKALALVDAVRGVSAGGKVGFVDVGDSDAIIERFPRLQAVSVPGGLFGGRPKLPADDLKTVGASYRLMARSSLSRVTAADMTQQLFELRPAAARVTAAAEYVQAPAYETTVAATSARVPIHPGALDYYEREQHGFVERYGDTIYLLAAVAGGLGSVLAWLRQRLARLQRERSDEVTDRLLEIVDEAAGLTDPEALAARAREIDRLAADLVREARRREPAPHTLATLGIALETAKATVAERRLALAPGPETTRPAFRLHRSGLASDS